MLKMAQYITDYRPIHVEKMGIRRFANKWSTSTSLLALASIFIIMRKANYIGPVLILTGTNTKVVTPVQCTVTGDRPAKPRNSAIGAPLQCSMGVTDPPIRGKRKVTPLRGRSLPLTTGATNCQLLLLTPHAHAMVPSSELLLELIRHFATKWSTSARVDVYLLER